jgi:hypothetical protein
MLPRREFLGVRRNETQRSSSCHSRDSSITRRKQLTQPSVQQQQQAASYCTSSQTWTCPAKSEVSILLGRILFDSSPRSDHAITHHHHHFYLFNNTWLVHDARIWHVSRLTHEVNVPLPPPYGVCIARHV